MQALLNAAFVSQRIPLRQRAVRAWKVVKLLASTRAFEKYREDILKSGSFTSHELSNAASSGFNIGGLVEDNGLRTRINAMRDRSVEFSGHFKDSRSRLEQATSRVGFLKVLSRIRREHEQFREELRAFKREMEAHTNKIPGAYAPMLIDSIDLSRSLLSSFAADIHQEEKPLVLRIMAISTFLNWAKAYFELDSCGLIIRSDAHMRIDRFMVGRVLENLALNAQQADASEIKIIAQANEPKVHITVRDNGNGIPAELLEQVFEEGFTTKTERRNHGLGLAIARSILARHEGTIHARRNDPQRGTTFEIELPLYVKPQG